MGCKTAAATMVALATAASLHAAEKASLAARIEAVMARPEFRHAHFGIEIYSLSKKKVLYALNEDKLFVPGSVTKIVTAGSALHILGGDHRFRTRVYRRGQLGADGELAGGLDLVASGDPNLSNRVRPDGTLAFENADHSYGHVMEASLVPGDPLQVLRNLARQVSARGVKRITGRVEVDASLFPEGAKEGGTGVVISPIVVNDNVIDVTVRAGAAPGERASLQVTPATPYARFESAVSTVAAGGEAAISFAVDAQREPLAVTVAGTIPVGASRPYPFAVPRPSRFAEMAFEEALRQEGVVVECPECGGTFDQRDPYTRETLLAEHVSPPLREEVKVMLKVSQNLHAATMPYVLGAGKPDPLEAGFARMRAFLEQAGLDVSAAAQSDGEGGTAWFSPSFLVRFLAYMADHKEGAAFRDALPVLGRDGTLSKTLVQSPAAGKLRAKTGTNVAGDLLNQQYLVRGKGLAGYLDAADGTRLAVVAFANHVPAGGDMKGVTAVGDALAEIVTAAYDAR